MSLVQLEGYLKAAVQLRTPRTAGRFRRGRRPSGDDVQWEAKTTRSVSMRRPRPNKS